MEQSLCFLQYWAVCEREVTVQVRVTSYRTGQGEREVTVHRVRVTSYRTRQGERGHSSQGQGHFLQNWAG